MRNVGIFTAGAVVAAMATAFCGAGGSVSALAASAPLLTQDQQKIDDLALSLRNDPAVQAARQKVLSSWAALPQAQLPDGKATLNGVVDDVVYGVLRSVAADPSRPQVIWSEAPAYTIGKLRVPSSRQGDSPDRIYRIAALDPRYSYVIRGHRNARASLDEFSFEALKPPAIVGEPQFHLSSKDIDIAQDGGFTITADSTPANGRRNHLYLAPGTSSVLIRDTLVDWASQLPNDLVIERVGGQDAAPRSRSELAGKAALEIEAVSNSTLPFLRLLAKAPANQLTPRIRPLAWGLPGSGLGMTRFSLQKTEALVVTLDPLGASYLGFVAGDPWQRSVNYWSHSGSLNNLQVKPNTDGTITYVLAASDPGVYNWLDTAGLSDGAVTIRWEGLRPNADIQQAVKSVRVVPIAELAKALPDAARIDQDGRRKLLAQRQAEYEQRTVTE